MSLFQPIPYAELNSRQKENYGDYPFEYTVFCLYG